MKHFKLKSLMDRKGITQEALSVKIGLTRFLVNRIVGGHVYPTLSDQKKIADALQVDAKELWGEE